MYSQAATGSYGAYPPLYYPPHGPKSLMHPPSPSNFTDHPPRPGEYAKPSQQPIMYHPRPLAPGEGNSNLGFVSTKQSHAGAGNQDSHHREQFGCDKSSTGCLLEGEGKDIGDERITFAQNNNMPPSVVPGYSQGHRYPSQPPSYYPPPYGNPPPETWNAPHPSYLPHYDTSNHYHIPPPYAYGINTPYPVSSSTGYVDMSPRGGHNPTERKRQRFSSNTSKCSVPTKERNFIHIPNPCKPSTTTKSVRRKKKMYSDFVGVTYNKTHAKYQACITHYRKQHYLGRYKLAVDAALAYDESARLLKGSSWKVNFPTRQAYEEAKLRELESIGKLGGSAVDVAGSLAAVALKVEEIASNCGHSGAIRKVGAGSDSKYGLHVGFLKTRCVEEINEGKYEKRLTPGLPPHEPVRSVIPTPAMSKVTPSPTFQMSSLTEQQESPSSIVNKIRSLETPLPLSPNPSRHTMGTEKSSPDSVIRPTVLTYKGGKEAKLSESTASKSPLPLIARTETAQDQVVEKLDRSEAKIIEIVRPLPKSEPKGTTTPNARLANIAPKAAPPVIQNGTLAAASALMTLFGNEKSP